MVGRKQPWRASEFAFSIFWLLYTDKQSNALQSVQDTVCIWSWLFLWFGFFSEVV